MLPGTVTWALAGTSRAVGPSDVDDPTTWFQDMASARATSRTVARTAWAVVTNLDKSSPEDDPREPNPSARAPGPERPNSAQPAATTVPVTANGSLTGREIVFGEIAFRYAASAAAMRRS